MKNGRSNKKRKSSASVATGMNVSPLTLYCYDSHDIVIRCRAFLMKGGLIIMEWGEGGGEGKVEWRWLWGKYMCLFVV